MRKEYIKPDVEIAYFTMNTSVMASVGGDPDGDEWNAGIGLSNIDEPGDLPGDDIIID